MADSSETAYHPKGDFFNLKGSNTDVKTEVGAGLTTFFAMAYIIIVNPNMLSQTGMKWGAVFLATIIASVIGTLIMGLFANVPYAQAPGMGLNAFFVFTVCFGLHYKWQEALAMVFICGLLNIAITVTKVRKLIIKSIPESLQNAIGGGIGIFIAYIGVKNAGLINFTSDPGTYTLLPSKTVVASSAAVPAIVKLNSPVVLLALFGLALTIILLVKNVKGAIIISIAVTTLLGIPLGITTVGNTMSFTEACSQLPETFLAAFGNPGMGSLFADPAKIPLVLMTIFAFSLSDTFDTIGTFIGTGRKAGIFSAEDQKALETSDGFKSKMDKALFADATATSIGAIFGTSNTTTYVESAAGIGYGGRTGLTSVVVAVLFIISAFFSPIISIVPSAATAPVLIIVGIMMLSSFKEIEWNKLEEAIPAFFASIFMAFCYSISYGIAAGFTVYCIVKTARGKAKEVHPILWVATGLFILNFVILAIIS
ncbi:NCS2 family permease [Caproiciproducens galactitolivorans]|uniref:Guanine/hypoxanthine permease PbuO n=1 Tax=Caproiciproducens galactitolivorans TaxID=642589 RepID=A0A4Z0Y0N0_9FIRM|nr:NCS2 family permease [Caproiciproducens galactitolivorans]QEY34911.1 NCS2 family permease [Caproiciproducens galactitolivorans]TGJ76387.1 guanine/hypoxanthine permease PbuO [Caproiciproducens galactitolivorans]